METALDTSAEGILIESDEQVIYSNAAYAQLLRYRGATDLVRRLTAELIAECDAERLVQFGRLRLSGKRAPASYDFAALCSDGSSLRLQASVSFSVNCGQPYIMTIVRPFAAAVESQGDGPIGGPHEELSPREREVMEMLLAGKRAKLIAFELGLTETTVATHRTRLLGKMGVADNRQLYQYALRHKLVDWS